MDFSEIKSYLLSKPGTFECFPFDAKTLVFKVGDKMFALTGLENDPLRINLKCHPEYAEALRALYPSVLPGYHMNKRHWNTVILDGFVPDAVLREMMDESYSLVVKSLSKAERDRLNSDRK